MKMAMVAAVVIGCASVALADCDVPLRPIGVFDSGIGGLSVLETRQVVVAPGTTNVYNGHAAFDAVAAAAIEPPFLFWQREILEPEQRAMAAVGVTQYAMLNSTVCSIGMSASTWLLRRAGACDEASRERG